PIGRMKFTTLRHEQKLDRQLLPPAKIQEIVQGTVRGRRDLKMVKRCFVLLQRQPCSPGALFCGYASTRIRLPALRIETIETRTPCPKGNPRRCQPAHDVVAVRPTRREAEPKPLPEQRAGLRAVWPRN